MRARLGRGRLAGAMASVALAWLVGAGCAAPQSAAPRAAPAESQAAPVAPGPAAVAPAAAAAARPPAEPVRLKFHFPSRSTSYLPWYVAIERGYFREAGLDVEMLQAPGTVGVQALIAGEMDFSASTTRPMVAIARGVPLKVVYVQSARANYWLIARPEIRTLADLRGRRIVTTGVGDAYSMFASAALQRAGLDPTQDVQFIGGGSSGGGGSDVLVGALVGGVADATVGNVLQRLAAESHGFVAIHSFAEDVTELQGGVSTGTRFLSGPPERVRGFFEAAVKGTRVMEQDFATSVDVLLKYIDIERPSAERGLSLVRPWLARDGMVGPAERQVVVTTAREAFQIEEELDPEQIFDFGPLEAAARAVDASGWKP